MTNFHTTSNLVMSNVTKVVLIATKNDGSILTIQSSYLGVHFDQNPIIKYNFNSSELNYKSKLVNSNVKFCLSYKWFYPSTKTLMLLNVDGSASSYIIPMYF